MTGSQGISDEHTWHISVVAETGSTNQDVVRAAGAGALRDRSVLRAEHQTAGRGRLDRTWDAPPGANLLVSIYFCTPQWEPADLMHRTGLAIIAGIETLAAWPGNDVVGAQLSLKWPNDVLLGDRKLAGVLAQRSTGMEGIVVGFGVNVGWCPPEAASVAEVASCTPDELLRAVLSSFDALPADIADLYADRLGTLGRAVRAELPDGSMLRGTATGVDADGRLEIADVDGRVTVLDVADVVHLRPSE